MPAAGVAERVRIVIDDFEFREIPDIYLAPGSPLLSSVNPHVAPGGKICYRTQGLGVLNAHAPANAIAACLREATEVIEMARKGGQLARTEIQREFAAYWDGAPLMSCGITGNDKTFILISEAEGRPQSYWVYENFELASALVRSMGMTAEFRVKTFTVRSAVPLRVGSEGPPKDMRQAMKWLRSLDRNLETRVVKVLETEDFFKDEEAFILILASNASVCLRPLLEKKDRQHFAKRPREFPHRLRHPFAAPIGLKRYTVEDASPMFIHTRNDQGTLENKRVLLIGAGSIGGYLADALARQGAGLGRGRLTIIDPQVLRAENLGRHRLGVDSLLKDKATALADRLRTEMPWLNIECHVGDALAWPALFHQDLVIDATGEEALGRALNIAHQGLDRDAKAPPILYVWIAGEGEGAQALWVDHDQSYGCWECQWNHKEHGHIEARARFVKHETQMRFLGCQAITPYGTSASMLAASLATEMVGDWLLGKVEPRFRSRARSHADVERRHDSSPDRLKRCPTCSRTKSGEA